MIGGDAIEFIKDKLSLIPPKLIRVQNGKKYAIMARRSKTLLHLDFDCISPQTLTRWEEDFKYN